jgi:hypothetical protein
MRLNPAPAPAVQSETEEDDARITSIQESVNRLRERLRALHVRR